MIIYKRFYCYCLSNESKIPLKSQKRTSVLLKLFERDYFA